MEIRKFVLLCVLLGGMGQGVVLPKLPELLHESTQLAFDSGLSATMMYLGIFLSTFHYGKMADSGRVHRLLSGGLFAYAGSLLCLAYVSSPLWIFATRFWEGVAISAVYVAADFVLGRVSAPGERGRWLSYYGVALSVGLMLGPSLVLMSPKLVQVFLPAAASADFMRAPMLLVAFTALALAASAIRYEVPRLQAETGDKPRMPWAPLACAAAYGYVEAGIVAVFPVLALSRFHVTTEYCLVVIILSAALFSIAWGEAADRFGARKIILILLALLALGSALLFGIAPAASPSFVAYALCLFIGSLVGGLYPVGFAWLLEGVSENNYGYASGAFARAYGLGSIVGPFASGFLVQHWFENGLFASFAALGFLAWFGIGMRSSGKSAVGKR